MKVLEIIVEGYKEAQAEFSQVHNNPEEVKDTISKYRSLVDRNQIQGEERNIDAWRKQGWERFKHFVDEKISGVSKTQIKRARIPDANSVVLMQNDHWYITVPTNKAASCNLGSNTDWCTAKFKKRHYEEYSSEGIILIYCIRFDKRKWAIAVDPQYISGKGNRNYELFDHQDNKLDDNTFHQQTGLSVHDIMKLAFSNPGVIAYEQKLRELPFDVGTNQIVKVTYHDALEYCNKLGPGWRLPTEDEALEYLNKVGSGAIKSPIHHFWIDEVYEDDGEGTIAVIDSMQITETQYVDLKKKYPVLPVRSKTAN